MHSFQEVTHSFHHKCLITLFNYQLLIYYKFLFGDTEIILVKIKFLVFNVNTMIFSFVLYHFAFFVCILLHLIAFFCIVLFCVLLYCIVLSYCIVLFCLIVLFFLFCCIVLCYILRKEVRINGNKR